MKVFRFILVIAATMLLASACSEDEPIYDSPVADFVVEEDLDEFFLYDNSYHPEGTPLNYRWNVDPAVVLLSNTDRPEVYFRIPYLDNPVDITVSLTVSDGQTESETQSALTLPVLNELRSFGLGINATAEISNNLEYEWYVDQANSGRFSGINCGPASTTMAIKWADSTFTGSTEEARNMILPDGGWWYTSNIINYLNHFGVNNYTLRLSSMDVVTQEIDNGNIAILCLDMFYISKQKKDRWRVDKFYHTANTGWGHFIVAKGYKVVDDQLFLEVYDPYGFEQAYSDGSAKGKDRYYRGDDILHSASIWWNNVIIVTREPLKTQKGLDPSTIRHQRGR